MRGSKAVVLEKNGSLLTVLSSDGSFQKIRYRGLVEVGAEIDMPAVKSVPTWRIGASVAAIFLLVFMGVFGWNIYQPGTAVAMLSVDINPSLQLTLDHKGRVLELQSLNPDGEQLLSGLPLKGEPWNEALNEIIEKSVELKYLNPQHAWVLVGYSPVKPDQKVLALEMDVEKITDQIEGATVGKGFSPKVAVYALTPEDQVQAKEKGLTLGEYALVNTAKNVGVHVEPQEVKKTAERVRLLENPEIQEQLKKEKRIKEVKEKELPANANPKAEKEQNLEPKKELKNLEDKSKSQKENGNKWLFNPNQLISPGQWKKSFKDLNRKSNETKYPGGDWKNDSDKGSSDEAKNNKLTGKERNH